MKIHDYAAQGDLEGVAKELRRGAKIDVRDEQDLTPLAIAARSSEAGVEMLRLLIESGANINTAVDSKKSSPVGLAADSGNLAKLRCLLEAGADVNAVLPRGYTPLITVLFHLRDNQQILPVVDLLVKHGAIIDAVTIYGESPITAAAMQGRFDIVKYLIDAGAKTNRLNWSPAMMAVCLGTANDLQAVVNDGGDLESRDYFDRTAWLLSATAGDVRKAELLLAQGADLEERGRMGDTALANCVARGNVGMTRWLIDVGADVNTADDFGNTPLIIASQTGQTECVQLLLDAGADPHWKNTGDDNALSLASNEPIIRLLINAGADLTDISKEMGRVLTHRGGSEKLHITRGQYLAGRYPRFGRANPEEMNIPFWREMVRTGIDAYQAKMQFDDTSMYDKPVWCFDRFGTSFTELPDGRFVQIAGEHEDYYDPDFCIYNDVVVYEPSGSFHIFGYPKDVFTPTDFHTATYVEGFIFIVGGLGYQDERQVGRTPVYRLNCQTWKIERVETSGDNPGWIYEHKAVLRSPKSLGISGGTVYHHQNETEGDRDSKQRFQLDLGTMIWSGID